MSLSRCSTILVLSFKTLNSKYKNTVVSICFLQRLIQRHYRPNLILPPPPPATKTVPTLPLLLPRTATSTTPATTTATATMATATINMKNSSRHCCHRRRFIRHRRRSCSRRRHRSSNRRRPHNNSTPSALPRPRPSKPDVARALCRIVSRPVSPTLHGRRFGDSQYLDKVSHKVVRRTRSDVVNSIPDVKRTL